MDNIVYGKTEGIKKRVLEQLQSLYDLHLDQGQLISEELALLLRDISESIGREAEEFGPYSAKEAARIPYGTLLQTIERILGKKTRSEKTGKEVERAMLVSLHWGEDCSRYCVEDSVEELAQLAETAGAIVAAKFVQSRPKPDPVFFIGKGKVEEMALFAQQEDIDLCLVDDDLSPAQQRNLEQALGVRIIDRTGLILDIFAKRIDFFSSF